MTSDKLDPSLHGFSPCAELKMFIGEKARKPQTVASAGIADSSSSMKSTTELLLYAYEQFSKLGFVFAVKLRRVPHCLGYQEYLERDPILEDYPYL